MVQKYQNESAPIFYYGKSPKINRKHLKIPYLHALTLGHVIKMTLYIVYRYCTLPFTAALIFLNPLNTTHNEDGNEGGSLVQRRVTVTGWQGTEDLRKSC